MKAEKRNALIKMLDSFSYDEMKEAFNIVRDIYKVAIDRKSAMAVLSINPGDIMTFKPRKRSRKKLICVVEKLNRKTVNVTALNDTRSFGSGLNAVGWRVSPENLKPATKAEIKKAVELAEKITFPKITLRDEYLEAAS